MLNARGKWTRVVCTAIARQTGWLYVGRRQRRRVPPDRSPQQRNILSMGGGTPARLAAFLLLREIARREAIGRGSFSIRPTNLMILN